LSGQYRHSPGSVAYSIGISTTSGRCNFCTRWSSCGWRLLVGTGGRVRGISGGLRCCNHCDLLRSSGQRPPVSTPITARPTMAAPVTRRAVVIRERPRRASRADAATRDRITHPPITICQIGATVASRPSLLAVEAAVRPPCPEAVVPGYAGLIRPLNCVDRDSGRTGVPAPRDDVIGNMWGRFDVDPIRHVTFSLPAGHRTETGRTCEYHSLP
jgi:hypothetical protein